jgi:Holliday junction resolvasome RuvABC DNA-binding subunit
VRSNAIEDALRALGYNVAEIRQALDGVELPDNEPDALREALAHLRRA